MGNARVAEARSLTANLVLLDNPNWGVTLAPAGALQLTVKRVSFHRRRLRSRHV
jgi:hypothetical protein